MTRFLRLILNFLLFIDFLNFDGCYDSSRQRSRRSKKQKVITPVYDQGKPTPRSWRNSAPRGQPVSISSPPVMGNNNNHAIPVTNGQRDSTKKSTAGIAGLGSGVGCTIGGVAGGSESADPGRSSVAEKEVENFLGAIQSSSEIATKNQSPTNTSSNQPLPPAPLPRTRSKTVLKTKSSWTVEEFINAKGKNVSEELKIRIANLHMSKNGLVYDVVGDGNCLFRAIGVSLSGDESGYADFRAWTVQRLPEVIGNTLRESTQTRGSLVGDRSSRWTIYHDNLRALDPNIPSEGRSSIDAYVNLIAKNGVWGGNLEMKTMAEILQQKIYCIDLGGRANMIHETKDFPQNPPLYIFMIVNHYYGFWDPRN